MACDPTSKKAKKRAREHAAAAAKVFKNHDPLCGKTWAVTEEEKQAAIDRGLAWGNENGAIRVVHAPDAQANPVVFEGGWGIGGVVIPKTEPTEWPDGISTKYEEGKIPEWIDTTPPKTEEELLKERVDKALVGWPWKGTPSKLVSTVRTVILILNLTLTFRRHLTHSTKMSSSHFQKQLKAPFYLRSYSVTTLFWRRFAICFSNIMTLPGSSLRPARKHGEL